MNKRQIATFERIIRYWEAVERAFFPTPRQAYEDGYRYCFGHD